MSHINKYGEIVRDSHAEYHASNLGHIAEKAQREASESLYKLFVDARRKQEKIGEEVLARIKEMLNGGAKCTEDSSQ